MVADTLCFDWYEAGFKARGWPAQLKEDGAATVSVQRLCDYFADPWTNPASGGVVGKTNIARELGVSPRQLQREVECGSASFIRRQGSLWASNVQSLDVFRQMNSLARDLAWSENSPFRRK